MSQQDKETATEMVQRMLGESGAAVVRLVEENNQHIDAKVAQAAAAIHTAVDSKLKEVSSAITERKEQLDKQRAALGGLAEKLDNKVDKTEFSSLEALIAQAGRTLASAMEAVNQAATASDPSEASKAADKAAEQTNRVGKDVDEFSEKFNALTERVSTLEKWKDETVEPALEELKKQGGRIRALESAKKPTPVSEEPTALYRPTLVERANPRNWGWMAWGLALLLGFIALVAALTAFCPWVSHVLNQQWPAVRATLSFLAGLTLTAIGFFGGGLLGDTVAKKMETEHSDA